MFSDDGSEAGDIIQQGAGSRRFAAPGWLRLLGPGSGAGGGPGWRPPRGGGAVLAAVTLLAGLAAGYVATRGTSGVAPRPSASRAPSAPIVEAPLSQPLSNFEPAMEQLTEACSSQSGTELQLAIQVTNTSAATVTVNGVKPVFEAAAGEYREVSWQRAPCGAIAHGLLPRTAVPLAPGSTISLSVTLKVLVRCPAAYPVKFNVSYVSGGARGTVSLPGFPGTGPVAYSGCGSQYQPGFSYHAPIVRPVR